MSGTAIEIELLGVPRWRAGDAWHELSRQDAALVAMVALDGTQPQPLLAYRLWPAAGATQAGNNLRKHLSRLGRKAGVRLLLAAADTLSMAPGATVDVLALDRLDPLSLAEREFLAPFDYGDGDDLERWVVARRAALRRARADALAAHAEALEKRGELAKALRWADVIVQLVPEQEHAWRRVMRLHYLRGDRTAAVAAFERLEEWLREGTGGVPSPETRALLATIESDAPPPATPVAPTPVALQRPPQRVGRDREWQAMARAWGGGRPFVVVGEAGMGKSRLLADFVARQRPPVVGENGRAGDEAVAFALLARVAEAVLALPVPPPDDFVRQELARIVPALGAPPQAAGQEAHLRQAMESLLAQAQRQGLAAVVVDDLHQADLASLEALRWLAGSPRLAGLRFGFATRPPTGAAAAMLADWLADSQRADRVVLEPLSADDVERLVASLGIARFAKAGVGARLYAHAGGHPLFTLATLQDAWQQGIDLLAGTLPLPASVEVLMQRRLRALAAPALDLLRVAAVAGPDLSADRAAALLGCSRFALADPWAQLEAANLMVGERFSHDLVRDCALGLVPAALRRTLHAELAALLAADATVPPGRVAHHWEQAERWPEAGAAWHAAGLAARRAGRLADQVQQLEAAAACHRRAGQPAAELEALLATFDARLLQHGAVAVLDALPAVRALVRTEREDLRCRLVEAEALIDLGRDAVPVATRAAEMAAEHPDLLGDALCLLGMALGQAGRIDDAIDAERRAADAALAAGQPAQELRAVRSLAVVLYAAGRLGEAVPVQRRALRLAESLGDPAEAAGADGNVAALLAVAGDVPAAYEHAARARRRYVDLGMSRHNTLVCVNLVVLGTTAAYLGAFDEALERLQEAVRMAGDAASPGIRAKSRIVLANTWLSLGCPDAARRTVADVPDDAPPGMQMQVALVHALAERHDGGSGHEGFARLAALMDQHPALPVVDSAWIEWSYQGDPVAVVARLRSLRPEFERLGLPGSARTLLLREVARGVEIDDSAEALAAARAAASLMPRIDDGLNAKSHPPEAWDILAQAFERAGDGAQAALARERARAWLLDRALPCVPAAYKASFRRQPLHRRLLGERG